MEVDNFIADNLDFLKAHKSCVRKPELFWYWFYFFFNIHAASKRSQTQKNTLHFIPFYSKQRYKRSRVATTGGNTERGRAQGPLGCWFCSFSISRYWNCQSLTQHPSSFLLSVRTWFPCGNGDGTWGAENHISRPPWELGLVIWHTTANEMHVKINGTSRESPLGRQALCATPRTPLGVHWRVYCPQPHSSQMSIHALLAKFPHVTGSVVWFIYSTNTYWALTTSWACADQVFQIQMSRGQASN